MTTFTNGHTNPDQREALPRRWLDEPAATHVDTHDSAVDDQLGVADLRKQVATRQAEQPLHRELAELDAHDPATETRSEQERRADRRVAEQLRGRARRERLRAGKAEVRQTRANRIRAAWNRRAEATRDRILDPARAVGSDHRRWITSTAILFGLLAGGVVWLASTVHDGLVGVNGPIVGWLVEPMASLLLVVSLLAQHTARQRSLPVPRGFLWFDAGLLAASLLLNTVPWGVRYGIDPAALVGHLLAPVLLVAVVVGIHLVSGAYSASITRHRPSERETAAAALLRAAVSNGQLAADVSASAATRWLREQWPGGIGQAEARAIVRVALDR